MNLLQLFVLNEFFFLSFLFLVLEKVVPDRFLMKVLELVIVEFSPKRISKLRILIHRGFEYSEVHNMFSPDVVSYVVVYIGQVCHISDSLLFSPLFVDGLSQFHEGFLQTLEVLVVELEHEAQVPFEFPCVSVKVVTVHELRLLGIDLGLIEVEFMHFIRLLIGLKVIRLLLMLIAKVFIIGKLIGMRRLGIVWAILRLHSKFQNITIKILYLSSPPYYNQTSRDYNLPLLIKVFIFKSIIFNPFFSGFLILSSSFFLFN